jgi:hypothetical protein
MTDRQLRMAITSPARVTGAQANGELAQARARQPENAEARVLPLPSHALAFTLRVGQERPPDIALAHVGERRTKIQEACDQGRLVGRQGGGEADVHTVLHRLVFRDGNDVDADRDRPGKVKPTGSRLVTPGSSLETLQPSASTQNRPSAESSQAFIAI